MQTKQNSRSELSQGLTYVAPPSKWLFIACFVLSMVVIFASLVFMYYKATDSYVGNIGSLIGGISQFIAFLWLAVACYYQMALLRVQIIDFHHQIKISKVTSNAQEVSSLFVILQQFRASLIDHLRNMMKRSTVYGGVSVENIDDAAVIRIVIHDERFRQSMIDRINDEKDPLTVSYIEEFINQYDQLYQSSLAIGFEHISASKLLQLSDVHIVCEIFREIVTENRSHLNLSNLTEVSF